MKNIKISIIIPVYNAEKYIEKCIESILKQSLKEIEIIVVNDGSKDNTFSILKKFQNHDNRIVIIDKKNEGVSKARNQGLKQAKGKYILNIDGDDWIEDNYLMDIYREAERNELDIVITDFFYDYRNTNKIIYSKDLDIMNNEILNSNQYFEKLLKENFKGFNCNKLFKKRIIDNFFITYDEEIKLMEDMLFLVKYIEHSTKIGKINKAYYHYVQHDTNVTRNLKMNHLIDTDKVFNKIKKIFENNNNLKLLLLERERVSKLEMILSYKDKISNKEYKKYIEKYVNSIKGKNIKNIKNSLAIKIVFYFIVLFPFKNLLILIKKILNVKKRYYHFNKTINKVFKI